MDYRKVENWQERPELRRLLDAPSPPKALYYLGHWQPELFEKTIAMVGSRRMSEYGRRVIEKIMPPINLAKKTVISGFMYGVDQYAHLQCVEGGGKTIAVLGWGIREPLAASDRPLAQKIIDSGGLLLSEWENQKAMLWTFPARNRIVAALADDVLVIEAAEKSGSLITANLATKLQRPLWAIPGPLTSRVSAGANQLIASGAAKMWLTEQQQQTPEHQSPLLQLIGGEGMTTDEIARTLGKPVQEVGAQLSLLTLSGEIKERGGKFYVEE